MSDLLGILIFLIPIVIAGLNYIDKIYKERSKQSSESQDQKQKSFFQSLSWIPIVVFILYMIYVVFGAKSITDNKVKDGKYEATIDSLTRNSDTLKLNMKVVQSQNETLNKALGALDVKFDISTEEGQKKIDSLITVTKNQKILIDSTEATLEFCITDSNLLFKEVSPKFYRSVVEFCSGNTTLHNVLVQNYYIRVKNGFSFMEKASTDLLNLERIPKNDHLIGETFLNRGVDADSVYFLFKFSFTDDKKRKTSYNDLYLKMPYKKTLTIPNKQYTTDIVNFLKTNKLW